MKKLIALAFVATFAVALAACGGGAKTEEKAPETTAPAADTTKAPADTTKTDTTAAH